MFLSTLGNDVQLQWLIYWAAHATLTDTCTIILCLWAGCTLYNKLQLWFLREIAKNKNTSRLLEKSKIPIKLHPLTVLVVCELCFVAEKEKMELVYTTCFVGIINKLGLRNEKMKHQI